MCSDLCTHGQLDPPPHAQSHSPHLNPDSSPALPPLPRLTHAQPRYPAPDHVLRVPSASPPASPVHRPSLCLPNTITPHATHTVHLNSVTSAGAPPLSPPTAQNDLATGSPSVLPAAARRLGLFRGPLSSGQSPPSSPRPGALELDTCLPSCLFLLCPPLPPLCDTPLTAQDLRWAFTKASLAGTTTSVPQTVWGNPSRPPRGGGSPPDLHNFLWTHFPCCALSRWMSLPLTSYFENGLVVYAD